MWRLIGSASKMKIAESEAVQQLAGLARATGGVSILVENAG